MAGYPLFCASHTVRGTCTIGIIRGAGANSTITVPEGVYWTDTKMRALNTASVPDLFGRVAYLIDTVDTGAYSVEAYPVAADTSTTSVFEATSGSNKFRPAASNAEGLRTMWRLGVSQVRDSGTAFGSTFEGGYIPGIWGPGNRRERMPSWVPRQQNAGGSAQAWGGDGWAFSVGAPSKRRTITLEQVDRARVVVESNAFNAGEVDISSDYSFESLMWPVLARGERVRIYSDPSLPTTYLTAACTAAATSISVASGTGIANADIIWVDGERMYVLSGGGTTTLDVHRQDPVAHAAYCPVSEGHVATYVLDVDGGNVNMGEFLPSRRAYNQPRYDLEISLIQVAG